ncbi:hypothetical protein F4775DRAFT_134215 [Biscogniauxia sp. FL1348]|nr:hypothetical protein F4775DRAFT_134215 [Biscogniauxia sp. FL1348]
MSFTKSSRPFSTSHRALVQWVGGYGRDRLPKEFQEAVQKYLENGAKKNVGEISTIRILHRGLKLSPIHRSRSDHDDAEPHLSTRITTTGSRRGKVHHIFGDGTGSSEKGGQRWYSTPTRHNMRKS